MFAGILRGKRDTHQKVPDIQIRQKSKGTSGHGLVLIPVEYEEGLTIFKITSTNLLWPIS